MNIFLTCLNRKYFEFLSKWLRLYAGSVCRGLDFDRKFASLGVSVCVCVGGGGGGGYSDIFIHMEAQAIFGGFKILNFNIFWGFRKNEYFWGYEDFVDIFWGHPKSGLYLGVTSMHFRVFS